MQQDTKNIQLIPKSPNVFDVELRLPFKTVRLGKIDYLGEGCFRSKRKWDNRHKKLHSWGVNAEVVEHNQFKWISIICDGKEYITSKPFLIQFAKRLTFKNWDAQYFLPVELWGIDLVKEFEKQEEMKPEQLTLFTEAA
jgi:hypothetical protein